MAIFWIAVVVTGTSTRLVSFVELDRMSSRKPQSRAAVVIDRVNTWLRRYITIPATFGYRRAQNLGWCTIPPRNQSLTILAFTMLNIVVSIHGYIVMPVNL